MEQIIKIVTDEDDLVLDPFCGSGTTLVASNLLSRRYIGIDISGDAVELTKQRLDNPIKTTSYLLENGEKEYFKKDEMEIAILNKLNAIPVQRNNGIDGFLREYYLGKPVPIKIQKENETFEQAKSNLLKASKKRDCILKILIKTEHEENLFGFIEENKDKYLVVIDSYDLVINDWLRNKASVEQD